VRGRRRAPHKQDVSITGPAFMMSRRRGGCSRDRM